MKSFEWLLAARYLKLANARKLSVFAGAGIVLVLTGMVFALEYAARAKTGWWSDFGMIYRNSLRLAEIIMVIALVLVTVFTLFAWRFTIFSAIGMYGMFLGSAALVIVLSVMSGFERDLKQKILGTNAHLVISNVGEHSQEILAALPTKVKGLLGATPFLTSEIMVASRTSLEGVVIKGIDPATVGSVTDLKRNITLGELDSLLHPETLHPRPVPQFDDEPFEDKKDKKKDEVDKKPAPVPTKDALPHKVLPGVVIGRELAKNLQLYLGDEVSLVSPFGGIGPTGPIPKARAFRVAAIFYSGMFEYDSKYVYISLPEAQRFLNQEGEVTGLELKLANADDTAPVIASLREHIGKQYEYQDWMELNRSLFSALKLEKIAMFVALCFIILVAAFAIVANGIMLILEKGREIAILKSMGASNQSLLISFILVGLIVGGVGMLTGVVAGVAACLSLERWGLSLDPEVYYITQLPVQMSAVEIAMVCGATLLIALVATAYPALLAARVRPAEILRGR